MNQDTKLGLALGMLVIGFAAAFCFPREDNPSWTTESVAESQDIDFIPVRSYQPKRQIDDNPAVDHSANDVEDSDNVVAPESEEISATQEETEEPEISMDASIPATPTTDVVEPTNAGEVTSTLPAMESETTTEAKPQTQAYITQPGDTLTGIAYRFLGSSNRYQELFEHNRDVLQSPDDLSVGMELQIPVSDRSMVKKSEPVNESQVTQQGDERLHEVRPGDTLEGISKRYFGTSRAVDLIQKANPAVKDPARLRVGMSLSIPQFQ